MIISPQMINLTYRSFILILESIQVLSLFIVLQSLSSLEYSCSCLLTLNQHGQSNSSHSALLANPQGILYLQLFEFLDPRAKLSQFVVHPKLCYRCLYILTSYRTNCWDQKLEVSFFLLLPWKICNFEHQSLFIFSMEIFISS